ncbi:TPA: hypothetical protein N0F65_001730 [Lagenidium giganteum]|uniref:ParB-like N-terminal domain-containing protein n=1 Tax=Lagenidium giganteum TaxID=4803 RepID=A0AAV2Z355_9STRA|nr:TPA: hypothetical protein N0F65_001730 [Lagenidium giganteum]
MRVYLEGVDLASDVIRGVFLQRMEEAEISESRKTRKHLWRPQTKDDSVLMGSSKVASLSELVAKKEMKDVNEFFLSRVTDPTSYFYRFRFDDVRHLMPQKAEVQLVDITWLKPHEQIVSMERVAGLKKATISWDAYTEPLLVDVKTGAILDGHHRYTVGQQLRLKQLPAVLVDYLGDSTITVDVWPGCGRTTLTKEEVIEMSLSPNVFPPKTSRHRFTESLPPISIPLMILRQNPTPIIDMTLPPSPKNEPVDLFAVPRLRRRTSLREVSFNLICGAQSLATSVTKSIFRTRLRKIDENDRTQLDVVKRRSPDSSDFFNVIRNNDPTSAFCKQTSATFEDLLSSDASVRKKFFLTRICDPTSYFYKYHFDAPAKREPKRAAIKLASIKWLKAHEHVVSWDRVDGLRRATVSWNAYLEPLLVDVATGAILDGHHRYNVGLQLELQTVPVVFVDYLNDDSITVDVWPDCGRDSLTKEEVIEMSLSDELFPPKTSRHKFSDDLPPISVPLDRLRQPIESNYVDL